jgi:hypothetical protein
MGNFMKIKRKEKGLLAMFQGISTKDNGAMICIKDMESYTVRQVDTKESFMREKNMDLGKKFSKMAILMKVLTI